MPLSITVMGDPIGPKRTRSIRFHDDPDGHRWYGISPNMARDMARYLMAAALRAEDDADEKTRVLWDVEDAINGVLNV